MIFILAIACIILYIFFIPFRLIINHPFLTIYYAFKDFYSYFRYLKFNNFVCGKFDAYDSGSSLVFGSGKTLSCVSKVISDYKRFNNKKVYDFHQKKFVIQKVHVLSNITFKNIPYEKLINLSQLVQICEKYKLNPDTKYRHCIICFIDECQNQLHSRSFKDNISPMLLKQLTECRHFNLNIIYDSPRFKQVDALLRQCTSLNIKNRKFWRFQCQSVYNAYDIDNADNIDKVKRLKHTGFFITDKLYNSYDSYEVVDNLVKASSKNDFLSDREILDLQCNQDTVNNTVNIKLKKRGLKK